VFGLATKHAHIANLLVLRSKCHNHHPDHMQALPGVLKGCFCVSVDDVTASASSRRLLRRRGAQLLGVPVKREAHMGYLLVPFTKKSYHISSGHEPCIKSGSRVQ
jgi:hypothetical protein